MGLGDPILRADNTATIVVKDSAPGTMLSKFNADGRAFDPVTWDRSRRTRS